MQAFPELPAPNRERVLELYPPTTEAARKEMIGLMMRMVISLAHKRSHCKRNLDELIGEGMLALTVAVNRLGQTAETHPKANAISYIWLAVYRAMSRHKAKMARRYAYRTGKESVEGASAPVIITSHMENIAQVRPNKRLELINDIISECVKDEVERQIVEMRKQNQTDSEIGQILQLTGARIGQIRRELKGRFEAKYGRTINN